MLTQTAALKRKGNALAAGLMAFCTAPALADDMWGCTCLLCVSNPAGAKAESECVPPITKLEKHLERGGSFPSCDMAGDGTYAEQVTASYDPCSLSGMENGPEGYVAEGSIESGKIVLTKVPQMNTVNKNANSAKICVSGYIGEYSWETQVFSGGSSLSDSYRTDETRTAAVYEKILVQEAQSARAIDVYVNGVLTNRYHW